MDYFTKRGTTSRRSLEGSYTRAGVYNIMTIFHKIGKTNYKAIVSPEEACSLMDFEDWYNEYENDLSIHWYELGCNYEVGNEFEDWIENFYYNNGGSDE